MTSVRIQRVQSLSHADLRRLLPRVLVGVELDWGHLCCTASFGDGRELEIMMGAETERRLGSLRIVSTPLEFRFHAWLPDGVAAFMAHVERALQQGGG